MSPGIVKQKGQPHEVSSTWLPTLALNKTEQNKTKTTTKSHANIEGVDVGFHFVCCKYNRLINKKNN